MDHDAVRLHGRLSSTRRKWDQAAELAAEHLGRSPRPYVSWSGGKDSTVVAHLTASVAPSVPIIRCSHGVDYPENVAYCAEVASRFGWSYHVAHVESAEQYAAKIDAYVEPSNGSYLADATGVLGYEPTGWLYGLRADESSGRWWRLVPRGGVWIAATGHLVTAPVWNWSLLDVLAYHDCHGIPLNPLYKRLSELGCPVHAQRVGFVIGGRGAEWGRYVWLRRGWPDLWARAAELAPWLREVS